MASCDVGSIFQHTVGAGRTSDQVLVANSNLYRLLQQAVSQTEKKYVPSVLIRCVFAAVA
jgi:hypothetical protein